LGALLNINRYDEYGKPQSTNSGRFQYTGQRWLSELGLYDYKARMYVPHIGIFAQLDPVGYPAGANLYAYVGNEPINLVDPLGLKKFDVAPTNPPKCIDLCNNTPAPPPTGTRIPGGISPGLFGSLGTGNASSNAGRGGGFGGAFHQITETTTYTSNFGPSFSISNTTYSIDFGGATLQLAGFGGGPSDAELRTRLRQYLRDAVVVALAAACGCKVDQSNIVPLNWNFARVLDPNKLPNIFGTSWSFHNLFSTTKSVDIGYGYELKYYANDRTITITTPTWSFEHAVGVPSYLLGDPVNTLNARGYCFYSKRC
jgi:RHS repeat-associated protein